MKTITLEEPGRFSLGETREPGEPGAGEALARVHRVGICGTDIHAYKGTMPFFTYPVIPGHELGVEVMAVGEGVENVAAGDRCAVEPYLNCGACSMCEAGKINACKSLKVLGIHTDGGMREQIIVPARKLHRSCALTSEQLALVETLGIGCHAVNRARVREDEAVLVIGAGPIGLTVITFAKAAGARVFALDINNDRLAFCRDHLGVDAVINGSEGNAMEQVGALLDGGLPAAVFDATGNGESMSRAPGFADSGGRVVFVGVYAGEFRVHDPEMHRKELTLLASRNARSEDFPFIIGKIESGEIDTGPWITHRSSCEEMVERFPGWTRPETGVIKAMVSMAD